MLKRMSTKQFTEWQAFYSVEPLPQRRLDILTGMICFWIYQVNRGKRGPKKSLKDFIPDWTKSGSGATTWQQQKFVAQMMSAWMNTK